MFDFLGKMNDIKTKMEETKSNLEQMEVHAISTNGKVQVTANGNRKLISIKIDDDFYSSSSKEYLIESLKEVINEVNTKSEMVLKEQMKQATAGLLPNIPGLGLD
jgi:nucleoid-associated protein EbfC